MRKQSEFDFTKNPRQKIRSSWKFNVFNIYEFATWKVGRARWFCTWIRLRAEHEPAFKRSGFLLHVTAKHAYPSLTHETCCVVHETMLPKLSQFKPLLYTLKYSSYSLLTIRKTWCTRENGRCRRLFWIFSKLLVESWARDGMLCEIRRRSRLNWFF